MMTSLDQLRRYAAEGRDFPKEIVTGKPTLQVPVHVVFITEDVQNVHLLLEYRPHIDVSLTCEHDPKLQEYCVCPQNMPQFDSEGIPNQAPERNKPMISNGPTSRNREGSDQPATALRNFISFASSLLLFFSVMIQVSLPYNSFGTDIIRLKINLFGLILMHLESNGRILNITFCLCRFKCYNINTPMTSGIRYSMDFFIISVAIGLKAYCDYRPDLVMSAVTKSFAKWA
ncbi:hypothetical protein ANN_10146 [Periplaneta americana]|uniref:Uncharacterized protein n=1 Tax=Periplaneta americana TaxID=6978 RepID=A0ABQ8TN89_PERAM|nr:hypothetical protein ANN_10146 [Periplaneta americana]